MAALRRRLGAVVVETLVRLVDERETVVVGREPTAVGDGWRGEWGPLHAAVAAATKMNAPTTPINVRVEPTRPFDFESSIYEILPEPRASAPAHGFGLRQGGGAGPGGRGELFVEGHDA